MGKSALDTVTHSLDLLLVSVVLHQDKTPPASISAATNKKTDFIETTPSSEPRKRKELPTQPKLARR
jgi:hypothetical protein